MPAKRIRKLAGCTLNVQPANVHKIFSRFKAGERMTETSTLIVDFFFIETVIGPELDRLSCQMNSRNGPYIKTRKSSALRLYFTDGTV